MASTAFANPTPLAIAWENDKEAALELYRDLLTRRPESEYFAARSEGFEEGEDPSVALEIRTLRDRNDWDVVLALEVLRELADNRDSLPSVGGPHLAALAFTEEARRQMEQRRDLFDVRRILKATAQGLAVGVCACGLASAVDTLGGMAYGAGPGEAVALPWDGTPASGTCIWNAPGTAEFFASVNREPGEGAQPRSMVRVICLVVPPLASGVSALTTRCHLSRQEALLAEIRDRGIRILEKATGMSRMGHLIRLYAR